MAHWNITQLTELKVQFLLEKCKVYFKVKNLSRVSTSVFWFTAQVYIILFCAFVLVFNPPTPTDRTYQQLPKRPFFRQEDCQILNFLFLSLFFEILTLFHNLRQALVQGF